MMLPAPVTALLDALDRVANSNTFLLTHTTSAEIKSITLTLFDYFQSAAFHNALLNADNARGWNNYSDFDTDSSTYIPRPGTTFWVEGTENLVVEPLTRSEFEAALIEMLTSTKNPYQRQMNEQPARSLVENFVTTLAPENDSPEWQFVKVQPNFLYFSGYFGTHHVANDDHKLAYFDGGYSDNCLVMYREKTIFVLLTNGSP